MFIWHDGEQRTSVSSNALADGSGYGVVAPLPDPGFRIRSDIGGHQAKTAFVIQDLATAFLGKQYRRVCFLVELRVAVHAMHDGVYEVLAAALALWRDLKLARGQ